MSDQQSMKPLISTPAQSRYDVIIVGGAIMGSSTAWFLADNPDFNGSVLVVEKDPSYAFCSTAHTNSCMRQQFSAELNVRISQFAADFVKNIRTYMGGDDRVPELSIRSFGYMYLADNEAFAETLRENQQVQHAAGAARTAAMAGLDVPVEPRKRFSWIFKAEQPLDQDLPLTIDPSGVHVRENGGGTYQCGGHAAIDPAVAFDDFEMDHSLWQDHVWPVLAARIPQFEAIRVTHEWGGHYAMNVFDHNAIMGPHHEVSNFIFLNGFSGHGLQQSPAMGRGTAEFLTYGEYRSLDLSPFNYERIINNNPIIEKAVI